MTVIVAVHNSKETGMTQFEWLESHFLMASSDPDKREHLHLGTTLVR